MSSVDCGSNVISIFKNFSVVFGSVLCMHPTPFLSCVPRTLPLGHSEMGWKSTSHFSSKSLRHVFMDQFHACVSWMGLRTLYAAYGILFSSFLLWKIEKAIVTIVLSCTSCHATSCDYICLLGGSSGRKGREKCKGISPTLFPPQGFPSPVFMVREKVFFSLVSLSLWSVYCCCFYSCYVATTVTRVTLWDMDLPQGRVGWIKNKTKGM